MPSLRYLMILCSCLLVPSTGQSYLQSPDNHVASLFIFGDSLFDAGNNNYLKNAAGRANFKPYGETFFKFPTGRFYDGRIIPVFIAGYLKLPLIPPYLQPGNHQFKNGVNFASGGAGALVETYAGMVVDLNTQFRYFMKVKKQLIHEIGKSQTKEMLSKAIYLFSVGGNDYGEPFLTNSSLLHHFTTKQYVAMVIGNLTTVIKGIYKNGGRKFGIVSLLDLGFLPSVRALEQINNSSVGFKEQTMDLIKRHIKALPKVLKQLKKQLPGFNYSIFDIYGATNARINNPSKYGWERGMLWVWTIQRSWEGVVLGVWGQELCENPSEYLFFDGGHPTEKFNHQLAKLMWSGSSKACNSEIAK